MYYYLQYIIKYYANQYQQLLRQKLQYIIMSQPIKYLQVKQQQQILAKRKQLKKSGVFNDLGPADCCFMFYSKQASFLSKKEQRIIFYFFQGLNVLPQNLSIKMREITQKQHLKTNKEKITKGLFIVYDIFEQIDIAIEVNIPGALRMFKISALKELLSAQQLERVYLSSVIRSMYGLNMTWGKYFKLFDCQNPIQEFKTFMTILLKNSHLKKVYVSDCYEAQAQIQGNHMFQIVYNYIKQQYIIHHALSFFTQYIQKNKEKFWQNQFAVILYTQLLYLECKFYKSLKAVTILTQKNGSDAYLLFYQAKYLLELNMVKQSLSILNTIKQYNQPSVWLLMAKIHLYEGAYTDVFQCLNILAKTMKPLSKYKPEYKQFESLGKAKKCERNDELKVFPSYLTFKKDILLCIEKSHPPEIYKQLYDLPCWRLNPLEFAIYSMIQQIRKSIDKSKFQKIIQDAFIGSSKEYTTVDFKKGLTKEVLNPIVSLVTQLQTEECDHPNLPRFLKSIDGIDKELYIDNKVQRSLSIIQQIQSFVESTIIRDKIIPIKPPKKSKHLLSQKFLRLVTLSWKENQIEKARRESNWKFLLTVFNSLRKSLFSNYIYNQMFHIFSENSNQKSILILLSEMLTDLEGLGVKRIQVLPYWIEHYVKGIIVDKGLQFLNELMKSLECYEEGLIDTIQSATKWKINGIEH